LDAQGAKAASGYYRLVTVRTLTARDVPDLMRLKEAAGWNQTPEDFHRLLRLEPDGLFGVDLDGRLAASASVITYGQELAWIGMVLTAPEYRGRGLARRLMDHSIAYCGTRLIGLDASDMGKPLYVSLGFKDQCPIERWRREPGAASFGVHVEVLRVDAALDRTSFGADRLALLNDLATSGGASSGSGYALMRPGSSAHYFGPCVCADVRDFNVLLRHCVELHGHGPIVMDLFPHNTAVADIARLSGFTPIRRLTRMFLPEMPEPLPHDRICAIAGFELG
jgi:GNAT superfamily N-acetyltransferase